MPNIITITDFNDPALDVYARLTEAQLLNRHCLKEGLFIAESPKVIDRALDAGYVPVSFLAEERLIRGEENRLDFDKITEVSKKVMARMRKHK